MPVHLAEIGGELIAQKDSFLAAAKGVSIGIAFQRKLGVGLFGGEGFIMQRLQGDGWAFVHAGGTLQERTLAAGELIRVDTGCIVALQPSVNYEIQFVGKIKTALFGGEGLFFATLRGPGRIWLQSLPLSRLANRIVSAVPGVARGGREEGSLLGGLGNLLDGDRSAYRVNLIPCRILAHAASSRGGWPSCGISRRLISVSNSPAIVRSVAPAATVPLKNWRYDVGVISSLTSWMQLWSSHPI